MGTNEREQYIERLKSKKAKITPQRLEILDIFLKNKHEHFTAEDLILKCDPKRTGQATVYRTLELFCKVGILQKVNFNKDELTQYDLIDLDKMHFHHHLICSECNRVIEITDDLLESIEERIQHIYHFKIENHELVLRGICDLCQKLEHEENS